MTATVLVTGPPRAGVSSLAACLRDRMPAVSVVEGAGGCAAEPAGAPAVADVVLFVVSAVAPVSESDCALAAAAARSTDAVLAVLAKVDDHRDWRTVLAVDKQRLAGHAPRFESVAWVPAAAAPRLGSPVVDDVVTALALLLADPSLVHRNVLRRAECGLTAALTAMRAPERDHRARVAALRDRRDALLRTRRSADSQRTVGERLRSQRARLESASTARARCTALRTELLDAAAETPRSGVAVTVQRVRQRCSELIAEVDQQVSVRLHELADELGATLPQAPPMPEVALAEPPLRQRRLESRVTTVLGAGFGCGAGLVVARWVTGLASGASLAGALAGATAGLILTLWVVAARTLLYRRAVLAQWVGEAVGTVRAVLDERIAARMIAAEAAIAEARLTARSTEDSGVAQRIMACDAELRGLTRAVRRAEALRAGCEPGLERALTTVREGLRETNSTRTPVTDR